MSYCSIVPITAIDSALAILKLQKEVMSIRTCICLFFSLIFLAAACKKEDDDENVGCTNCPDEDLIDVSYDPQAYTLEIPEWLPDPIIPEDNPMTVDGVMLGRQLFYEKKLSSDGSMSCGSCHLQEKGFTDGLATSVGVLGMNGSRSSMSIVNLVFNTNGFFWDGRVATLEEQALLPIEDHLEFNESWDNVMEKLKEDEAYPSLFRKAFGIERKSEMTKELAAKAIAQFERTIISGNSRFDQIVEQNMGWPTDAELRGQQLFFFELAQDLDHPGCSHCHFNPLYTDNEYKNNGLDAVEEMEDFEDPGLGGVNGNIFDYGKFRVPTLRNIEHTAPYMHDGRLATLEDVLDEYSKGGHGVINEDPNIQEFTLSEQDKQDLIAFLKMLTDEELLTNPAFSDPN